MTISRLRAFTLIELLVVIAIIALLAAILFPVFSSARDRARQTTCTNNLKQIYLAYRQYSQDFDGCYPEKDPLGSSAYRFLADPKSMPSLMEPYTKTKQIWICPSQPEKWKEAAMPGYWWSVNQNAARNPDASEDGSDLDILVWENYSFHTPTPIGTTTSPKAWSSKEGRYCAHVGRTNFNSLFADGHVKLYPKKQAQNICKVQIEL